MQYRGVEVYHIYKDNDRTQGSRSYWFWWTPEGRECDRYDREFDIRSLYSFPDRDAAYQSQMEQVLKDYIDLVFTRGTWLPWDYATRLDRSVKQGDWRRGPRPNYKRAIMPFSFEGEWSLKTPSQVNYPYKLDQRVAR